MAKKEKQLKRDPNKKFFNYKKRRGDRTDGWRVHANDPLFDVIPHVMPDRNDAQVFFEERLECDTLDKFVRQMRRSDEYNMPGLSRVAVLMSACVRALARYPKVNRFCAGSKIYARNHCCVSMTVKRSMHIDSEETVIKPYFNPDATLQQVYDTLANEMNGCKGEESQNNATDDFVSNLTSVPQWLIKLFVAWVKHRDKRKGLPKSILKITPFHTSCFITDIGSAGIGSVYHHIYNLGTCSIFISMGKIEKTLVLDDNGQPKYVNTINLRYVIDERVADGFYYAKTVRYITHLLKHPELLLTPPEEVIEDPLK